ncbi:hypothetical protein COCC4DRAFT_147290, partial [Bipolaris maydis ATCC 48331]
VSASGEYSHPIIISPAYGGKCVVTVKISRKPISTKTLLLTKGPSNPTSLCRTSKW